MLLGTLVRQVWLLKLTVMITNNSRNMNISTLTHLHVMLHSELKLEYRLENLNKNYNYNILFAEYTLFNYVNIATVWDTALVQVRWILLW